MSPKPNQTPTPLWHAPSSVFQQGGAPSVCEAKLTNCQPNEHSCPGAQGSAHRARDAPRHLCPGPGTPVAPSPEPRSGSAGAALLVRQLQPTWAQQLHRSRAGAQLPLSSGLHPCTFPRHWAGAPGTRRTSRGGWGVAPRHGATRMDGGSWHPGAAAPKSLAGPPPFSICPPEHQRPRSPAHPSRWASFFSRSWMTSSSTRMVCWLVSSTPSRDCSWDCSSPCAPGPRGASP